MSQQSPQIVSYSDWINIHYSFFQEYHFPIEPLAKVLYNKLLNNQMDAGQYFSIDTSLDPTLLYTPEDQSQMLAYSNIFYTDHVWSPGTVEINTEWKKLEDLRARLSSFLTYSDPISDPVSLDELLSQCDGKSLEIEYYDLSQLAPLSIPTRFPNLEILSLIGNQLSDPQELLNTISSLPNLKGLWFTNNPLSSDEASQTSLEASILESCPSLEILNSRFTSCYTSWALRFISKSIDDQAVVVMDLSDRGIKSLKEEAFRPFSNLQKVDLRGNPGLNLSNLFTAIPLLHSLFLEDVSLASNGITYSDRLVFINGVAEGGEISLSVPGRIWDHIQPAGKRWGVGDEIALSIHHSLNPNFAAMPVGSPINGLTYFSFWPIKDISNFDEVTANLFPKIEFGDLSAALTPQPLLPMVSLKSRFQSTVTRRNVLKVFTDIDIFAKNLHSKHFIITDNRDEADLLWIGCAPLDDFEEIYNKHIFINQIENENVLTVKDLLYQTVTKYMGHVPWLPETFVLSESNDVALFLHRNEELKKHSQSHAWVVKPFNQSRANFIIVTEEPAEALRNASVGPRIAQRYIWNPLNIYGKKFDLRFIVLLKSVKPLELYVYKVFWPRIAPKLWALDDFDDYERHFTVMNYKAPDKVTSKTWVDFKEQFEKENPGVSWNEVLHNCYKAIRDMFICCAQEMVAKPYTKAMYGIDLMITNQYQPVILECNFQPDCHRACDLCETFVDDVFEVLFIQSPVTCQNVEYIPLD